jgi:hypothetical protein
MLLVGFLVIGNAPTARSKPAQMPGFAGLLDGTACLTE